MREILPFTLGVVASVGCFTVGFYWYSNKKQGTKTRNRRRNVNRQAATERRRDQAAVKDLEDSFFKGMNNIMNLTPVQVEKLKDWLRKASPENEGQFGGDLHNLDDIIKRMKQANLITTGSYVSIQLCLKAIGINGEPIAWHIKGLTEAIKDLSNGFDPMVFQLAPFEFDAVIIHCDEDKADVFNFMKNAKDLNIPDLSLCTADDYNISKPRLRCLEDVFWRARYVFIYVTPNFSEDELNRFLTGMTLTESLEDDEKKWRIIPIWASSTHRVHLPELNQFPGLKYWQYSDPTYKEHFLRNFRDTLIKGRNEINQAY